MVEEQVTRGPVFKTYELRPLDQTTTRNIVESRPAWGGLIESSQQPHRVANLLGNPLLLSIAALTWSPSERPTPLTGAADPEDALWTAFFDRKLGRHNDELSSLRRTSGWVAGLATQVPEAYFRASNLYQSSLAVWATLAIRRGSDTVPRLARRVGF